MTRTVCVVTGSRADYGLLRWVMEGIRESPKLHLRREIRYNFQSPDDEWVLTD